MGEIKAGTDMTVTTTTKKEVRKKDRKEERVGGRQR